MAELKRLAKDTAIYGLSSIAGRFLNWLLVPIYTRVLDSTGDYGIVTNIYGWTALLLIILTYGMETGFFRFVNKKEETEPLRVYSTTLYSVGATSLIFMSVIFLFLTPVSNALGYTTHSEYIGMMAFIVATDAFCCIPFAYLRYQNRPVRFALIRLSNIILNIILNIFFLVICPRLNESAPEMISWFYHTGYGVGYIIISNIITTIFTLVMLLPSFIPAMRQTPDIKRLKGMLNYSFPILILGIAGILNQTADKILFPFLFDNKEYADTQLGIYGACFKIAVIMVMFIQAFRYAYEPFIFAKNRDADNRKSYSDAMKYFIIFALAIFLCVMFYLDIIRYFVGSDYYEGLKVVPIVMLGEIFFGIYFNLSIWYKLTDRTKWGAYFSITGCLVTVLIIVIFTPRYGFMACAWASLISNFLMMVLSYFIGKKYYPVKYDVNSAVFYSFLALACYCVAMTPDITSIVIRLIYRTFVIAIYSGTAFYFVFIRKRNRTN